ncbi:MAG: glutamate formimidoyltransferase [Candidatus Eisenbacteria bacterium]|nr:glutamate formimidoyltransferase [Candidatus Eisenbacteria bacterium]
MRRLVECIPNFSEGKRKEVIDSIAREILAVRGVKLLDKEMNGDHNRAVMTFVGQPEEVREAAFRAVKTATELIDLRTHKGEHPRMGATDVLPFVPIKGVSIDECVSLAKEVGGRIGEELGVPVFLYELAATRPERENLADVRSGEFEGLSLELGKNPLRKPDFGPDSIHPTAGALAVGVRRPLLAFNVNLGTPDISVAQKIAKAVRFRDGGLKYVKALGFELKERGIVQVSMNLVNTWGTPIQRVMAIVRSEAERYGVPVVGTEIVGLVHLDPLLDVVQHHLSLESFSRKQIVDERVAELMEDVPGAVRDFVDNVSSGTPTPGGGAVSALSGSLSCALLIMAANLTIGKKKYEANWEELRGLRDELEKLKSRFIDLVDEDSKAYEDLVDERKRAKATPGTEADARIREATLNAARVPLETARLSGKVLSIAERVAYTGNPNLASDIGVACELAITAFKGGRLNVLINIADVTGGDVEKMIDELKRLEEGSRASLKIAVGKVESLVSKESLSGKASS